MGWLDYLVDTNVWLRILSLASPLRPPARHAIATLLRRGDDLCVAPQNLIEFWNVSTRPQKDNGFGKTVAETDRYCRFLESFLTVLPETPALFARWRELAVDHEVSGKKVHDARLVAAMSVHRIRLILTFNTKDFVRYKDVEAVRPEEV